MSLKVEPIDLRIFALDSVASMTQNSSYLHSSPESNSIYGSKESFNAFPSQKPRTGFVYGLLSTFVAIPLCYPGQICCQDRSQLLLSPSVSKLKALLWLKQDPRVLH